MGKYFRNFDHYDYEFPVVTSYEEAERLYENIRPIRGIRGPLDLRPIGRRRYGFSFVKKMDGAYRIWTTYSQSTWALRRNNGGNPYDYSGSDVTVDFYKDKIVVRLGYTHVESCAMLAACVDLVRYNSKLYIETSKGMILLPTHTDIILKKRAGEWQVANPVREEIKKLSAKEKKKITKELQDWFLWAKKMWAFIEIPTPSGWFFEGLDMEDLPKTVEFLRKCKQVSFDRRYNCESQQYTNRQLSFEEFRKRRWRQARVCRYRLAETKKVRVPLGKPAPRQEF